MSFLYCNASASTSLNSVSLNKYWLWRLLDLKAISLQPDSQF
jgi:hypothetical protein